jgi:tetratricopeptide (TPR) repeat protein
MPSPLADLPGQYKPWAIFLLLICLTSGLFFAPVVEMGLAEHDADTLRDNALISNDLGYFSSPHKAQITGRPVAELAKWLASLLCGDDPHLLHVAGISLHTLAAILLAALLRKMAADLLLCFSASFLFLTNIGHFYAVYHFSGIDYPLALVLVLLGMTCYVQLVAAGGKIWIVGAWFFFGCGVLSHIGAIAVLPFCLYWSTLCGNNRRKILQDIIPLSIFLLSLSIAAVKLTPQHTNAQRSLDMLSTAAAGFDSILGLTKQLFWFTSKLLTFSHLLTRSWHGRATWEFYAGAAIVGLLLALIWKRHKPLSAWSVWTLMALIPFALVEDPAVLGWPEVMSRYLYLATAGSSVCIAWGLCYASRIFGRHLIYPSMIALMLFSYSGLRVLDNYYLYRAGYYLWIDGEKKAGIAQVGQAIRQGGDILPIGSIYFRLCNMILSIGDPVDSTLTAARTALPEDDRLLTLEYAINSFDSDPAVAQRARQAIAREFQRNAALGPAAEERYREMTGTIYRFTGHSFYSRQQWRQATDSYEIAAKLSSSDFTGDAFIGRHAHALTQLGIAFAKEGAFDPAIDYFRRALLVKPNISAYFNMGRVFKEQESFVAAVDSYNKGLILEPNNIILLNSLGVAELALGNIAKAVALFRRVTVIDPDYAPAQQNLSMLAELITE